MYARRVGQRTLSFDFSERLFKDNLLVVDRETGSTWSQLAGRAIRGPLAGTPLRRIPSIQTTWRYWRDRHPDTLVRVLPGARGRPYFYRDRFLGFASPLLHRHHATRLGLGLVRAGTAIFLPLRRLRTSADPLEIELSGAKLSVHHPGGALTAWAEDEKGTLLPGVLTYRDAWQRFHGRSRIFPAPAS